MFSQLIKLYRKATNKTQEEIAYLLGISTNHLSRIERGLTSPSGDLINRIIKLTTSDDCLLLTKITNSSVAGLIMLIHINKLPDDKRQLVFEEVLRYINLINQINTHN